MRALSSTYLTSLRGFRPALGKKPSRAPSPLKIIFDQIEDCLSAGIHYAALSVALSLPDICSSLELEPGKPGWWKVERRYPAWCEQYFTVKYHRLTGREVWGLRGGVLHNATLHGHPKLDDKRIVLTLPRPGGNTFIEGRGENNQGTADKYLQLDLSTFCRRMIEAAEAWYAAKHWDPLVIQNLPNLVQYRSGGYGDFQGLAVIA